MKWTCNWLSWITSAVVTILEVTDNPCDDDATRLQQRFYKKCETKYQGSEWNGEEKARKQMWKNEHQLQTETCNHPKQGQRQDQKNCGLVDGSIYPNKSTVLRRWITHFANICQYLPNSCPWFQILANIGNQGQKGLQRHRLWFLHPSWQLLRT